MEQVDREGVAPGRAQRGRSARLAQPGAPLAAAALRIEREAHGKADEHRPEPGEHGVPVDRAMNGRHADDEEPGDARLRGRLQQDPGYDGGGAECGVRPSQKRT